MSQSWLLKFGLGGVQDFISQSTRVRELAAGSILVSRAALAAARALPAASAELILPAITPSAEDSGANFPHQIIARVRVDGAAIDPREAVFSIATAMSDAARGFWTTTAEASLKELSAELRKRFLPEPTVKRAQLEDTLETYWVGMPETGNYRRDFDELLRAFEDRRWTRNFKELPEFSNPAHWAWTCTQCGVRVSLLQPEAGMEWPRGTYFARRKERLCSTCTARRQWSLANLESYPSTHRFARDRFFRHPAHASLLGDLRDKGLSDVNIGIWLEDLDEEATGEMRSPASRAMAVAREFLKADGDRFQLSPSLPSYYALVLLDGDQMGRWFSGEFFPQSEDLERCQTDLSMALRSFASSLRSKIADRDAFPGEAVRLVYAGGDDALLLAPVDFLFPLLRLLYATWEESFNPGEAVDASRGHEPPTFTLHASLVHEKAPLQPTVARLHHLLDTAKVRLNRDGFSILCDVRAGSETHFLAKWHELEAMIQAAEAFSTWRLEDPGQIPSSLATRRAALATTLLRSIESTVGGFFDSEHLVLKDPLRRELHRLAGRSGKTAPAQWEGVENWLMARAGMNIDSNQGDPLRGREAFSTAIETLGFLARELKW